MDLAVDIRLPYAGFQAIAAPRPGPRDVWVADLLGELNHRIDDPDFKIGPSYFMRSAVYQPGGLDRTWRTSILPLLEEHHYGDGTDIPGT